MFNKGARIVLSDEALDNYGQHFKGVVFLVTHVATRYMPAAQFFPRKPEGYHPGYDEAANGGPLYDLAYEHSGVDFGNSLYGWEVKAAPKPKEAD